MNPEDVHNFLSRWSRRKLAKGAPDAKEERTPVAETATPPAEDAAPAQPAPEPLPAVESLTPESDFKAFMKADVDPVVKRSALKQLFKDPQFNVMDGLDTYVEDYSIPDPIPEAMMKTLYQARELLFSPEEKAAADAAAATAAQASEAGAEPAGEAAGGVVPAAPPIEPSKDA